MEPQILKFFSSDVKSPFKDPMIYSTIKNRKVQANSTNLITVIIIQKWVVFPQDYPYHDCVATWVDKDIH